jgi:hypothetical protein
MRPIVNEWPKVLAVMAALAIGCIVLPWIDWDKVFDALEEFNRPKAHVTVLAPTVLVVSAQERDRFLVKCAMEPRGYAMRAVDSVKQGRDVMNEQGAQIAMVVVDTAISGSRSLLRASRSKFPHARLIELRGNRDATQVSSVLLGAATGT